MGKGNDPNCVGSPMLADLVSDARAQAEREQLLAGVRTMGFPAVYEVGGCVRDDLMGKAPKDIDLMVCGVSYDELKAICDQHGRCEVLESKGQLLGVRFRSSFTPKGGVEIALARTEVSTGAGHGDFAIVPLGVPDDLKDTPVADRASATQLRAHLDADMIRRDLTVNAIARDVMTGEIIDLFGGVQDVRDGVLRAVSDDTFRDDPLRCFRTLARMAKDGSAPDDTTEQMLRDWADRLRLQDLPDPERADPHGDPLAQDRVRDELKKILGFGDEPARYSAYALRHARDWGLLQRMLPEFGPAVGFDQRNPHHSLTVDEHTFVALEAADRLNMPATVKLAVLMHDIGKPVCFQLREDGSQMFIGHDRAGAQLASQALNRLRFDRDAERDVWYLVEHHMFSADEGFADRPVDKQDMRARKFLARHGHERARALCQLRRCDRAGKNDLAIEDPSLFVDLDAFEAALARNAHHPVTVKQLKLNGKDLIDLGLPPGPKTGEILRGLLGHVVAKPELNDPGWLRLQAARDVVAATGDQGTAAFALVTDARAARRARKERARAERPTQS